MPTILQGDWFELAADADLALFTGNSTITKYGRLVMGRGLARQVRDRLHGVDWAIAQAIGRRSVYGVAVASEPFRVGRAAVGAFQVKRFWGDAADPALIAHSVSCLNELLSRQPAGYRVVLNYPGIGNGRLSVEQVAPLLEAFDDRVTICYL